MASSETRLPNALTKRQAMLLLRGKDRFEAYKALQEASVPLLDMEIVIKPPDDRDFDHSRFDKEKLQAEGFDLHFWSRFKDGGMPQPWDVDAGDLLDFRGRIYTKHNEHLGGALSIFGEGARSIVLKQMSRTWWLRKAKRHIQEGRFAAIDWSSEEDYLQGEGTHILSGADREILERGRLYLLQRIKILQELLDGLLDRSAHQILNPMIERSPNPILELHKARFPDLDVIHDIMDVELVGQVLKRIEVFLHRNGDGEKWLAADKDERTEEAYTEWLDALPFENDLVDLAVQRKISVWLRENPIGGEIPPFKGLVGHVIRINLRLLRETVPIAENGGKPLSIRRMAERLNTKPVTLSRLETGKKAALYPMWIRQYASVLGLAESEFFPLAMSGLDMRSQVVDGEAIEGTSIVAATDAEVAALKLNRRLFEEREVEFKKELQDRMNELAVLNTKLGDALSKAQHNEDMVKDYSEKAERQATEHKMLLEENHKLRIENERTFVGYEGKPARNTLPIYGRALGGQFSDILLFNNSVAIDYVGVPYNLVGVKDAFAVMCSGDSMSPKYENGDILHCHPHKRIRRGHYIVVEWDEGDECRATIGRYVTAAGSKVTVEKLNPPSSVIFDFRRIFRIIGMTEAEG